MVRTNKASSSMSVNIGQKRGEISQPFDEYGTISGNETKTERLQRRVICDACCTGAVGAGAGAGAGAVGDGDGYA